MNQEEQNWINDCRRGKTEAFRLLVDKYQHFAYTLAVRITKNDEDAEEVTQDAFVKAFKSLSGFKGESKFSTWFYKIVLHLAMTKVRRKKYDFQNIDEIREAVEVDNDMQRKKDRTYYVEKAINSLPEDETAMVSLFYMEGQSVEDIAAVFNLSISNTKVKLFRARKKMAEVLQNELKENLYTIL
ncbi:MAG: sigma-70 family RNA polymerase sigma factor [Bacteroidales bacterium]|jgi:RNA polymerase sigma-70 factor (ECF subfamily)|nr:sigma-70 family RNA polymerase sigma factor [Bacteroidales bacterium]MDD4214483.1 sigma-70 family RNA polymerase sigma factor [Bacteroidales bacterium]